MSPERFVKGESERTSSAYKLDQISYTRRIPAPINSIASTSDNVCCTTEKCFNICCRGTSTSIRFAAHVFQSA
jgi:hypothetical protein